MENGTCVQISECIISRTEISRSELEGFRAGKTQRGLAHGGGAVFSSLSFRSYRPHSNEADCMAKLGSGQIKPRAHHIALLALPVDDVGLTRQRQRQKPSPRPETRKSIRLFGRAGCRWQPGGGSGGWALAGEVLVVLVTRRVRVANLSVLPVCTDALRVGRTGVTVCLNLLFSPAAPLWNA